MRVSTSTRSCEGVLGEKKVLHYSMPQALEKIAAAGYRVADLSFLTYTKGDREMTRDTWEQWVEDTAAAVEANGLEISQAHAHAFNPRPETSQQDMDYHEELIRRSIVAAGKTGVKWLVIHPVYIMDEVWVSWKRSLEHNLKRFDRYLQWAQPWNVGIAVENIHGANRVHRFGAGPEDLLELLHRLDSPNMGICWDTGHANLCGIDQRAAIEMMGSHLKATHIADNDGLTDQHLAPYLGKVSWKTVVQALKQTGYTGDFTFEIPTYMAGFDPDIHQQALVFTRQLGEHLLTL